VIGNIKIKINIASCLNDLTGASWMKNKNVSGEFNSQGPLSQTALANLAELEKSTGFKANLQKNHSIVLIIDDSERFIKFYNKKLMDYAAEMLKEFSTVRKITFPIYVTEPYNFDFPELFSCYPVYIEKTSNNLMQLSSDR
jgi:hypothetical protein